MNKIVKRNSKDGVSYKLLNQEFLKEIIRKAVASTWRARNLFAVELDNFEVIIRLNGRPLENSLIIRVSYPI